MQKIILLFLFFVLAFSIANAQQNKQPGATANAQQQRNKQALAFYRSGVQLRSQNKLPEAIGALRKSVTLDKTFDSSHALLGLVYYLAGKMDSGFYFFKKAITLNSENSMANMGIGFMYRDVKSNYDSAIYCFARILDLDSARNMKDDSLHKLCYYSLAWCYNTQKKYDKAIQAATQAMDIDNNYRIAYSELGHAIHMSQQYELGIALFKKRIAISEMDLPNLYLGLIYVEQKNKELAMSQYEKLKTMNEKMAASLKKNIDKMQ